MALLQGINPKTARDLELVFGISSDVLKDFERGISDLREPILKQKEFVALLSQHVADAEARALADMLIYIGFLARRRGFTPHDTATFLESSIQATTSPEGATNNRYEITRALVRIAEHPSIKALIKALDLSTEYTNSFENARVITDIRPIFDDLGKNVVAAIISHVLRLTYLQDGDIKSISIAMDDSDLKKLRHACKRAETKTEAIEGSERAKLSEIAFVRTGEAFNVT